MWPRLGGSRGVRCLFGAALLVTGTIGPAAVLAPTSASAGLLPTTTTLMVAPVSSVNGQQVTITAAVKLLGALPGLGITPTGTVTFTSTDGTHHFAVGSAPLGFCLLTTCTATLQSASLPVGTSSITGTYSGDAVSNPSSGSFAAAVSLNRSPGSSSTVNCYPGNPCDSGVVRADPSTSLEVLTSASANAQTVMASITPGALAHCREFEGDPVGELGNFSTTATDVTKQINYTVDGAAATSLENAYTASGTLFLGCYASTNPFNGYTNGVYGPAPQVIEPAPIGTVFEANLSSCANNSGQKPCFTIVQNGFGPPHAVLEVFTNTPDPHLTGP